MTLDAIIPIIGQIVPGSVDIDHVTESKYVKGGYIVVETLEEREKLLEDNRTAIVHGSHVYVSSVDTTYVYDSLTEEWIEEKRSGSSEFNGTLLGSSVICDVNYITSRKVGGIEVGTNLKGKTYDQIIAMMMYDKDYPTFTEPSIAIELDKITGPIGEPLRVKGTFKFNRGTIVPAYGTSGNRAGVPISYSWNGETYTTDKLEYTFYNTIENIKPGANIIHYSVRYEQGEQPLNNMGDKFGEPLEGTTLRKTFTITGLTPMLVGTVQADEVTSNEVQLNESYFDETSEGAGYDVTLPPESDEKHNIFALPASCEVKGLQIWDDLQGAWQWLGNDYKESVKYFKKRQQPLNKEYSDTLVEYAVYESDKNYDDLSLMERKVRVYIKLPENLIDSLVEQAKEKEYVLVVYDTREMGEHLVSQKIEKGQRPTRPQILMKADGYTFDNWYKDSLCTTPYDFDVPVNESRVVYAKWNKDPVDDSQLKALQGQVETMQQTLSGLEERVNALENPTD